ncbi:MAG: dockerin type I repeat-containing protein, partial [Bacteroidaceae bacterium]|nr:dockerin type I repeat-containing protein [Bacteroidaceae bacterium]
MKKFYLFLATVLAMLCTVSVDAQRYSLLEEATGGPEAGTTYVIMNAGTNLLISCEYGPSGGMKEVMDNDNVLWQIEATGEKTEAGYDLWYLYSVGQQKYVQEVDLEGNPGLDGYDVYSYNGFNWELTTDKSKAAKMVIEKGVPGEDEIEGEVWRTNGPSSGFVISRQNLPIWVSEGVESPKMMKIACQGTNVAWEPYNDGCVSWQFWTVKRNSAQEELEQLVDEYSKIEFLGGNDPGFCPAALVDAYNASLEYAMLLVLQVASEEEYQAAINDLRAKRAAVEGKTIPLTEGYYFFVCAFEKYLNEFGHEKAAYVPTDVMQLYQKTFDPEDPIFLFEITSAGLKDEYWVQHVLTGTYVGTPSGWYGVNIPITYEKEGMQSIRYYDGGNSVGKWFWGTSKYSGKTSYTKNTSASTPSDNDGALVNWGQWGDEGTVSDQYNCWYLRKVTDLNFINSAIEQKAQAQRTQQIKELVIDAQSLYAKLFTYKTSDEALITVAEGTWGIDMGGENTNVEGNQILFSHIRGQGVATADDYKFLIDGDDETYMQGSGYVEVDISKTPQQRVTFTYETRCASMEKGNANQHKWGVQERPNMVEIYAAKDTVDGGDWVKVGSTSLGTLDPSELTTPFDPVSYTLDMGDTYGFLRYSVVSNANGGSYFTLSNFQVYPATVDETTSQYYTTEGLKEKADALMEIVEAKSAAADVATDADIAELKAAFNAVQELYADTAALSALAEECYNLATTAVVGDEIGELSDESLAETLEAAATTAKEKISPAVTVEEVKEQMTVLRTAKENFLNGIKSFEPNTIYYLENMSSAAEFGDRVLYASSPDSKSVLKAGIVGENYDEYSAETMWMFVPAETDGLFYLQNVATGFYATEYGEVDGDATLSYRAIPYEVKYTGYGAFSFVPTNSLNKSGAALALKVATTGDPAATFAKVEAGTSTSWTIKPLSEDIEAISTSFITLYPEGILALPYNLTDVAEVNEGLKLYGVKKMTQETDLEGHPITIIELYEATDFTSNEAVFYTYEGTETQLTIPLPAVLSATKDYGNGLVGMPYAQFSKAGVAYATAEGWQVTTTPVSIGAQSGVIDPAFYVGEVADVETSKTLVLVGLNALPSGGEKGDVDGNGTVNSADVVAIYNFILGGEEETGIAKALADVDGNGDVNSADVVAVYNIIIGGGSESKAFA